MEHRRRGFGVAIRRPKADDGFMIRRAPTAAALAALAILTAIPSSYSAENDLADIKAEVAKRHNESVKRLADWMKQVSIAAEDRGFPEGAEHMAQGA